MTQLNKPITRRTYLDPRLGRKAAGDVSVTLYPNNTIGFRKVRYKKEFVLSLDACFSLAMKQHAVAELKEKRRLKEIERRAK